MSAYARTLDQLRRRRDRDAFRRLTEEQARSAPLRALRYCLPGLDGADARILLELGDEQLRVRPCFGEPGTVLTVRGHAAVEALTLIGADLGPGVVRLVVVPGLGREGLGELLEAMPLHELRALRIEGNNLRCREARVRSGPDNVIHLRIEGDDQVLQAIAALPSLVDLRLGENRLGIAGARVLGTLSGLRRLDLRANGIGDAGIARLARLPLHDLRLEDNGLGPAAIQAIGTMQDLRRLDLSRNALGGETLAPLVALPALQWLRLAWCELDDAAIRVLAGLRSTPRLLLEGNPLTEADRALLERFPGLRG